MGQFLQEIMEQPQAFERLLGNYVEKEHEGLIRTKYEFAKGVRNVIFTGMGSSYFAAHVAANFLNENGIAAFACEAGELLHYNIGGIRNNDLLIAVSQSGKTIEVKEIVKKLKGKITVVGVTNNENSYLGRNCNILLPMYAGQEKMTTSKTYTNTIALLLILAETLVDDLGNTRKEELYQIPQFMQNLLTDWEIKIDPIVRFLENIPFLHLVSRGPSYATVMQSSVILKEAAHIYAEGLSGASFKHGPIEIVDSRHGAIVFAPRGKTLELNIKTAHELVNLGSSVVLISNTDESYQNNNLYQVTLPVVDEYLFPLLDIIPIEFLIVKIAQKKGLEPGELLVTQKGIVEE